MQQNKNQGKKIQLESKRGNHPKPRPAYQRKIRLRIAGLYIKDNKILLVKHRKAGLEYYLLPGGGQEPGESSQEALVREWKEELNLDIEAGDFLFCGESVPPKSLAKSQVMQLVFLVKSLKGEISVTPDGALVGSDWIDIKKLKSIRLFPACLDQILQYIQNRQPDHYSRYIWLT